MDEARRAVRLPIASVDRAQAQGPCSTRIDCGDCVVTPGIPGGHMAKLSRYTASGTVGCSAAPSLRLAQVSAVTTSTLPVDSACVAALCPYVNVQPMAVAGRRSDRRCLRRLHEYGGWFTPRDLVVFNG